jgi:P27 family predicted phage terminase small subunit
MGKRGRLPKQKENLVGHRDNSLTVIEGKGAIEKPLPNSKWTVATKRYWDEYWASDISNATQMVDLPALYRLYQFYDAVERANKTIARQGNAGLLGTGSKGQATINPLITLTMKLEEKILKLEQELGLTPLSRQRLGIAYGENQMGFHQLQQLLQQDDKELADPRLLMLEEE